MFTDFLQFNLLDRIFEGRVNAYDELPNIKSSLLQYDIYTR